MSAATTAELVGSTAYRLLPEEQVGEGTKRVILARVDDAIAELQGETESDHAEAVHQARKDMKKVRAALRLVRSELGDDLYRRENNHYRDVGRMLSEFRDAEVRVESLDALIERFDPALEERFGPLREAFVAELEEIRVGGEIERAMAAAGASLSEGRERIESLPLSGDGWELLAPGLHRSYRRGRKRLHDVEQNASVVNLHQWRKRVKDLWYQLRLIRNAELELIGHLVRDTDDLSDHLGDDHDLALLREEGARRDKAFATSGDQRLLFELVDRRRGELQFAAITLGQRVYREKPKKFVKRLEQRWHSR